MKKILFVTGSMGRGGAEKVISILGAYYVKNGWDVSIAMLLHNNVQYELPSTIHIVNCSSEKGIKRDFIKVMKKFRNYVKKEKPDVIVCFMAQNILLAGIALGSLKIPFIASERIDPSCVKRNIVYRFILNRIYEKSNLVIFQTKRAQDYFNSKIRRNSCIIYNPIKIFSERSENYKHKIVSVGRFTPQKNQIMLINGFKKVYDKYPNYSLWIYGDGPLRAQMENIIKEYGIEDNVFLPGVVSDVHAKIADAEMFVLPSNFEGLSNALMEAMLMGLPVISTDCSGSDEIIINEHNGLLIPVGDEERLVEAIERLINDEELKKLISNNARKSILPYEESQIIKQWDDAINSVIK